MNKWLSKAEIKKLKKSIEEQEQIDKAHGRWIGIRNRALIEFSLETGFRPSETRNTRICDLFLSKKEDVPYVKVRTLKRRKKVIHSVEISPDLAKILSRYLEEMKRHGKKVDDKSYLFSGRHGKKAPLITIEKAVKSIFKKADLPGRYSAHSLRHSHGFNVYVESDSNAKLTQDRLRHASLQATGIYIGVQEGEETRVLSKLFK